MCDWNKKLVIGVSSRALFDLTSENEIFEKEGIDAYCRYQMEHEDEILKKGPGFGLIEALLKVNPEERMDLPQVLKICDEYISKQDNSITVCSKAFLSSLNSC